MTKIFQYFLIVMLIATTISCDKVEFNSEFTQSYNAWQAFKSKSKNSYMYVATSESWSGWSWETTITVKNGEIISRSMIVPALGSILRPEGGWTAEVAVEALKQIGYQDSEIQSIFNGNVLSSLQWDENESQLGSNRDGAELLTMDEIYTKTRDIWLKRTKDGKIYFESNNQGMISLAGYVPKDCMDDCFTGIKISFIKQIE